MRKTQKCINHINTHLRKLQTVLVSVPAEVIGYASREYASIR